MRVPVSPEERLIALDVRRERKMAESAHAYVRGSTERFYRWLLSSRGKSLPKGPAIWIGGDCHVGNLGPVAHSDGSVDIQLRDLDQTVIGTPAHDVIRFALSMAMAVRASALPGAVTLSVIEGIARGYESVMEAFAARREFTPGAPPAEVKAIMTEAGQRSRKDLFTERLGKNPREIPIGKKFWPLVDEERTSVEEFIRSEDMRGLVTTLLSDPEVQADIRLADAAFWVKGCSSLGVFRCAALVEVETKKSKELRLFDIKEARPPLAPRTKGSRLPRHNGQRVVTGARKLSPNLGERMVSATIAGRPVFVRELLPQDLKFDLEHLSEESAVQVAEHLASVVALAHARQLDAAGCAAWVTEFRKTLARGTDAPAWLWAAVVDLTALHEGGYLEHCREHAPRPEPPRRGTDAEDVVVSHHVEAAD
jgi:uncharacterized protein (DUF2252 family)